MHGHGQQPGLWQQCIVGSLLCTTCSLSCPLSSRQVHHDGQAKYVGRLSRQAAAVGADIVTTWQQQCVASKVAQRVSRMCLFVCL